MPKQAFSLQRLENGLRQFFIALAVIATAAGVAIIVLVGTSVAMRRLADAPFRFTEELVGLLMTAAFFLALPLVTLDADHVRVRILVSSLPTRLATWVGVVAAVFGILFSLWFFWLCLPWFEFAYQRSIRTEVGRLLMYPWMGLLPVSMLLTSVAFVVRAFGNGDSDTGAAISQRQ